MMLSDLACVCLIDHRQNQSNTPGPLVARWQIMSGERGFTFHGYWHMEERKDPPSHKWTGGQIRAEWTSIHSH